MDECYLHPESDCEIKAVGTAVAVTSKSEYRLCQVHADEYTGGSDSVFRWVPDLDPPTDDEVREAIESIVASTSRVTRAGVTRDASRSVTSDE